MLSYSNFYHTWQGNGALLTPASFQWGTGRGNTDKKEKEIFLICKEIHMRSVAKSFLRKGFLIQFMKKCGNI
jgi:hypothetical protein